MSATSHPPQGLRERNKERRRSTILNCAYQLFAERGYQATTIADIAAAADIAPRTVSLYFPSKQDIVLDGVLGMLQPISDAIDQLQPGDSAIDAILQALRVRLKETRQPELEHLPMKLKADPEIYGIITATVENLEQNGVRVIARELGRSPDDPQVRVTLAAMRGIVEHAMFASNAEEVDEIVDIGLTFLRAGMNVIKPASA